MVAVNSLLYFLLSAGLSSNPDQAQDIAGYDPLIADGLDLSKLCPPNEQLSECEAHCQKNCTNYATPFPCPRICIKGCICNEGLVRDLSGKCVEPKQCPGRDTCPPNQHYEQCNAHCERNWTNPDGLAPCPRLCVHGCVCNKPLMRGPRGKCIIYGEESSQEEVSESFCPLNEEYSQCSAHCQRDCSNWANEELKCTENCVPGCVCKEGSVRGPGGHCVFPRQCPPRVQEVEEIPVEEASKPSCPKNEVFSDCEAHCQKNCTSYKKPSACPKICVKGCVCGKGLVRGLDGKCVAPKQCPGKDICPKGEHYDQCKANCQTNCTTYGRGFECDRNTCVHGCVCDLGTIRGPKDKCIEPNQCPSKPTNPTNPTKPTKPSLKCPKNEVFSDCEAHCQKNCTSYKKPLPCPKICVRGCVCDKGLVRGLDGKCVAPKQCPGKDICPKGEHYDQCQANCQTNCTTYGRGFECDRNTCVYGCVCNVGTIRGPKGKCIKPTQCPKKSEIGSSTDYSAESIEQDVPIAEEYPEECTLEKKVGPCRARIPRYFFNQETRQCEKFYYGGCEQNENNFVTKEACERRCRKIAEPESSLTSEEQSEELPTECTLELDRGSCHGHFPRYYFNKETNQCERFIFGGCRGNENNFESKRLCERKCLSGSRSSAEMTSQEQIEVQAEELPEECTLEKVEGPCYGFFPRYFFNNATNQCEHFIYGGCGGNKNNFWFKSTCEKKCLSGSTTSDGSNPEEESEIRAEELPEQCTLEKEAGPCRGNFPRFFFNKETNKCEEFIYGGCQGNENRFLSKRMCERKCLRGSRSSAEMTSQEQSEVQAEELPEQCTLEKEVGPCRGNFPRFFFNKETEKCEQFIYGGCQGNENRFLSKRMCERKCLRGHRSSVETNPEEESEVRAEELPAECTLEKEEGPCHGYFPRYFFNKETNKCEQFVYGGCGGNKNNFEAKRFCQKKCLSDSRTASQPSYEEESEIQTEELPAECTLEKEEGPCHGYFPRYFFNKETNKCEQFVYGGCGGNKNNFEAKRFCERKCLRGSSRSSDVSSREESEVKAEDDSESSTVWPSEESIAIPRECTLPKKVGPCQGYFPRYYYNKDTEQCQYFLYGGCQGNENNFETHEQCEQRCSTSELH